MIKFPSLLLTAFSATKSSSFQSIGVIFFDNELIHFQKLKYSFSEMRKFLSLQGEQYDLIKNHVDSLSTLNDRGYDKTNSPPENTFPILLDNFGYTAINPFVGNLNDTLGNYLTGVTSIDDIKNNTWRKTLNNLLYIFFFISNLY